MYNDHQVLVSSFTPYLNNQTKGLLARWHLRSPYLAHIILEHKPGSVNKAADALTRAPLLISEGDIPTIEVLRVETKK